MAGGGSEADTAVAVGVLGPTVLRSTGGDVLGRSPRLAALLAWLVLLARHEPASAEQARRDLYGHLSAVRGRREVARQADRLDQLLGAAGRLVEDEGSFGLQLVGAVDVDRFEGELRASADESQPAAWRLARCSAGLDRWRGPRAYADLEGLPVAVVEADRLDEQRERLVDLRDGLRIVTGADLTLILELEQRWGQQPERPIVVRQLAVALARAGRTAEGLQVLGAAVQRLGPGVVDAAWRRVEAALLEGEVPQEVAALVLPAPSVPAEGGHAEGGHAESG